MTDDNVVDFPERESQPEPEQEDPNQTVDPQGDLTNVVIGFTPFGSVAMTTTDREGEQMTVVLPIEQAQKVAMDLIAMTTILIQSRIAAMMQEQAAVAQLRNKIHIPGQ